MLHASQAALPAHAIPGAWRPGDVMVGAIYGSKRICMCMYMLASPTALLLLLLLTPTGVQQDRRRRLRQGPAACPLPRPGPRVALQHLWRRGGGPPRQVSKQHDVLTTHTAPPSSPHFCPDHSRNGINHRHAAQQPAALDRALSTSILASLMDSFIAVSASPGSVGVPFFCVCVRCLYSLKHPLTNNQPQPPPPPDRQPRPQLGGAQRGRGGALRGPLRVQPAQSAAERDGGAE